MTVARRRSRIAWALPLVPALLLSACGRTEKAPAAVAPESRDVVARVGNTVITADEVKQRISDQAPIMQARYRDPAFRKQFVENLVRSELLAQEAYRRGLDKTPEMQAAIKRQLSQELVRQFNDEYEKSAAPTKDELRAYYDGHIGDFVKPERVRAQHLFIAGAETDKAARAKAKEKAAALLAQLKANEALSAVTHPKHKQYNPSLFGDLARAESADSTTKAVGGDMAGFLSREDMAKRFNPSLADAVFALQAANSLSGLVETPQGFHLARLTTRQIAVNRDFEDPQVQDIIRGRLLREQRAKAFDALLDGIKQDANVIINEDVLASMEMPAPPAPFGMPGGRANPPPREPVAGTPAQQ